MEWEAEQAEREIEELLERKREERHLTEATMAYILAKQWMKYYHHSLMDKQA